LELISGEGKPVEREDVGNLHEFLPIGTIAPAFALENLSGKEISLEKLLAQQKSLLLFFVSPTCSPCAALLPEIELWQKELGERFEFVLISSGKAAENSGKFGTSFKNILLQKEKEVSENYKSIWTPTLLVVNSEGFVASRPAVGDEAIRELIETAKTENEIEYFAPPNGNGTMKIGENMPEFSLKDLQGKEWTAKDFQNRKTLVTFWSQTCGYCNAMREELENWDKTKGADAPDLLILSSSEAEAHKDLQFSSPVLLDEGFQTATKLGMAGTPSAVLVNENGKIISETAVGADNIWILLGEKK
jgi:thiol-disulfide isomerase/thioredoxin